MKNIGKSLLLLTLLISFTSCNQNKKKPSDEIESDEKEIYNAPDQIISLEDADSLYVNYKNRRIPIIEKMEGAYQTDNRAFNPTQFISFDIEVLKDYIGYVEQEAKKGGTRVDSLRVYLGNYGTSSSKYPNKNTVFLLPTAKVDGGYGGIFIDTDGKAQLIRDWVNMRSGGSKKEQKAKASIVPSISSSAAIQNGTSLVLNRGNGGPPPKTDF